MCSRTVWSSFQARDTWSWQINPCFGVCFLLLLLLLPPPPREKLFFEGEKKNVAFISNQNIHLWVQFEGGLVVVVSSLVSTFKPCVCACLGSSCMYVAELKVLIATSSIKPLEIFHLAISTWEITVNNMLARPRNFIISIGAPFKAC